jgi:hypothetical protein
MIGAVVRKASGFAPIARRSKAAPKGTKRPGSSQAAWKVWHQPPAPAPATNASRVPDKRGRGCFEGSPDLSFCSGRGIIVDRSVVLTPVMNVVWMLAAPHFRSAPFCQPSAKQRKSKLEKFPEAPNCRTHAAISNNRASTNNGIVRGLAPDVDDAPPPTIQHRQCPAGTRRRRGRRRHRRATRIAQGGSSITPDCR